MSNDLLVLERELVTPTTTFMIAGFEQWANGGNVSSSIPEYLIQKLQIPRIGYIRKNDFYIYQLPEGHYMFRPSVKYEEGYEIAYQEEPRNDFHYVEIDGKGLVIFIGTEPIQHEDVYVNILLDAAKEFGVKRIVVPENLLDYAH